jgi:outer membrane murein-binding lipoprotein Lpp
MKCWQYHRKLLLQTYNMVLCALLLGLAGCAESTVLDQLTSEPPAGILARQADILRNDTHAATWPNLAAVPPRPTDTPSLSARRQELKDLSAQREAGLKLLPPATTGK